MHLFLNPYFLLQACAVALLGEEAISLQASCLLVAEKALGLLSTVANLPS